MALNFQVMLSSRNSNIFLLPFLVSFFSVDILNIDKVTCKAVPFVCLQPFFSPPPGTATQPQAAMHPANDIHKQLSSSANELSDRWADRTPHSRGPFSFERGGGGRLCHSSPSKRRIGFRRGAQVFWGSKACLPGRLLPSCLV